MNKESIGRHENLRQIPSNFSLLFPLTLFFEKRVKGQMFIITIIFLIGLIFTVQQILIQGFSIDLPSSFQEDDFYFIRAVKTIFDSAAYSDLSCGDMMELSDFIERQAKDIGFDLNIERITYNDGFSSCNDQGNFNVNPDSVNITFSLTGKGISRQAVI